MKNTKSLLILFCTICSIYCNAQSAINLNISPNYIDSIENAVQIENLLIKTGGNKYENYKVNIDLSFPSSECKKVCDSLKIKAWQKGDFNNDGNSDILFSARNGNNYFVLCIITEGKNKYEIIPITRELSSYSQGSCAVVHYSNLKTSIDYYYFRSVYDPKNTYPKPAFIKTQLVYEYGDFIEVNNNPYQHAIEKIIFTQSKGNFESPAYNLSITNDKSAIWAWDSKYYNVVKGKEVKGSYETKLINYNYSYLIQLLNYIDFENLDNNYSVPWTDDLSCVIMITYDNGKVKRISDYGCMGTFGLQRTYKILFKLWDTQDWHKKY